MSDPVIISREDLFALGDRIAEKAITETLRELGIKPRDFNPRISFNQACKLVSRADLEAAMREGRIAFKKRDANKRNSTIDLSRKDVLKLTKEPKF
jgi:hypothetical protein